MLMTKSSNPKYAPNPNDLISVPFPIVEKGRNKWASSVSSHEIWEQLLCFVSFVLSLEYIAETIHCRQRRSSSARRNLLVLFGDESSFSIRIVFSSVPWVKNGNGSMLYDCVTESKVHMESDSDYCTGRMTAASRQALLVCCSSYLDCTAGFQLSTDSLCTGISFRQMHLQASKTSCRWAGGSDTWRVTHQPRLIFGIIMGATQLQLSPKTQDLPSFETLLDGICVEACISIANANAA